MEIQEAVAEYLKSIKQLGAFTQTNYAQKLNVFAAWAKEQHIQLEQVRSLVIDDFVEHLKQYHHSNEPGKAMSTHTLAGYVRQIKVFLHWCLEDEIYEAYLKESVVRKIKLPRQEQFVKETFTDEQLELMRKACEKEMSEHLKLRAQCILALLLCTGVRANELCTLKIADVHLDPREPYIKVHGKGNKWREVPLIAPNLDDQTGTARIDHHAREMLSTYKQMYRAKASASASFFVNRTLRAPMGTDGLERLLNRLEYQSGITEIACNPHRFRHTFSARFMMVFSDIYLLSKMLGHTSVATTERYLKSISGTGARMALMRKLKSER